MIIFDKYSYNQPLFLSRKLLLIHFIKLFLYSFHFCSRSFELPSNVMSFVVFARLKSNSKRVNRITDFTDFLIFVEEMPISDINDQMTIYKRIQQPLHFPWEDYHVNSIKREYEITFKDPSLVLLITFSRFSLHEQSKTGHCHEYLELYELGRLEVTSNKIWRKCGVQRIPPIFSSTSVKFVYYSGSRMVKYGFSLLYSLLSRSSFISSVDGRGLVDCSRNFSLLRPHFECNLVVECTDSVDEHDECPYHVLGHDHVHREYHCPPGQVKMTVSNKILLCAMS